MLARSPTAASTGSMGIRRPMTKVMTRRPKNVTASEKRRPPPARSRRLTPRRKWAPLSADGVAIALAEAILGFDMALTWLLVDVVVLRHFVRGPDEEVVDLR